MKFIQIKKVDFDKVYSNKTRHIEVNTKLDDIEKKVKIISTKGLTVDLINKYSIPNGSKYFSSNGLPNYLVFTSNDLLVEYIGNNNFSEIESMKSIGLSQERIENLYTSDILFLQS